MDDRPYILCSILLLKVRKSLEQRTGMKTTSASHAPVSPLPVFNTFNTATKHLPFYYYYLLLYVITATNLFKVLPYFAHKHARTHAEHSNITLARSRQNARVTCVSTQHGCPIDTAVRPSLSATVPYVLQLLLPLNTANQRCPLLKACAVSIQGPTAPAVCSGNQQRTVLKPSQCYLPTLHLKWQRAVGLYPEVQPVFTRSRPTCTTYIHATLSSNRKRRANVYMVHKTAVF